MDQARSGALKDRVPQVKMHRRRALLGDRRRQDPAEGRDPVQHGQADGSKWPGLEFIDHQFEDVHPSSYEPRERWR